MNKYIKPLILVVAFLVLALVTVSSYAYFSATVQGNDNAYDTVITSGEMALMLNDGEQISLNNAIPGDSIVKEFSVKNTGTVETTYDVYFSELFNSFEDNDDLVYTLSSTNGCAPVKQITVPNDVGEQSKITSCSIEPNTTHEYILTIYFKEDGTIQDDNKGKKFSAKISLNEYKEYYSKGYLIEGGHFASLMVSVSGDSSNISSIQFSEIAPTDDDNYILLPTANNFFESDYPIYMWNKNGIVYLYTKNKVIYLNRSCVCMFYSLTDLESVDLSKFDTSYVTDMESMFANCPKLKTLDLSNFNTDNVIKMNTMFMDDTSIETLDLSSFNTSNVTRTDAMFMGMNNLEKIYTSGDWVFNKLSNSIGMFYRCSKLKGQANTAYTTSHMDAEYARIDDPANDKPGYFTLKTN